MNRRATVLAAAVFVWIAALATARDSDAEDLNDLARAAEGDTLNLVVQGVGGHEATVRAFQARFPKVHVRLTVQNPSAMAPRIVTEQQQGIFAWDSWWGLTTAMTDTVLPAGGLADINDYIVLPDIEDPNTWIAPDYRYTSKDKPFVFIHSMNVERSILFNRDVVKGLKIGSPRDLLDPRLKGRIAIREPTRGNSGTYAMVALLKAEGPDFVRQLLTRQEPVIIENSRQLTDGALRGDYAVVIGGGGDILNRCRQFGGCRSVEVLPFGGSLANRGVAVLRNAPHPAATRLWVNWLLSREGEAVYVRQWARYENTGAVSLRRDVPPDPHQLDSIPDYGHLYRYALSGFEQGRPEIAALRRIVRQVQPKLRKPLPVSTKIVLGLAAAIILAVTGIAIVRRRRGRPAALTQ